MNTWNNFKDHKGQEKYERTCTEIHMVCEGGYHSAKERAWRLGFHLQFFSTLSLLALGPETGHSLWVCFLVSKIKALSFMTSNMISNCKLLFLSYSHSET